MGPCNVLITNLIDQSLPYPAQRAACTVGNLRTTLLSGPVCIPTVLLVLLVGPCNDLTPNLIPTVLLLVYTVVVREKPQGVGFLFKLDLPEKGE